jgi:hypothetical protein
MTPHLGRTGTGVALGFFSGVIVGDGGGDVAVAVGNATVGGTLVLVPTTTATAWVGCGAGSRI